MSHSPPSEDDGAAASSTEAPETTGRRRRLEQLRDRFVALNLRSRTLRLLRPTRSGALDLHRLAACAPERFAALTARLGTEFEGAVSLLPVTGARDEARQLGDDIAHLVRLAQATWQETGAPELAIGWPFLEGRAHDGSWLRAPMLLYPIALQHSTSGQLRWEARLDGAPTPNPALFQTLARLEGVRLDIETLLHDDDDGRFDVDGGTWDALLTALRRQGITAHVAADRPDPDALPDLEPLGARTREQREEAPLGRFTLRHHVVLGRFPRWGSTLVGDYEALLDGPLDAEALGLATDVLGVDEDADWDEEPPLEDAEGDLAEPDAVLQGRRRWQVLPSDTSQDAVFRYLDQPDARGLVVQGPPGTGKSQLITNLVASAVASGERVLLVCQKRAALDVVAARLGALGLADPVALVHDVERDRNTVGDSIAAALEPALTQRDATATARASHSAQRLHDEALQQLEARLAQARDAWTLLTESRNGWPPLVELDEHAMSDDGRALPELRDEAASVTQAEAIAAVPRVETLARATEPLAAPHPLARRRDWSQEKPAGLDLIFAHLRDARDLLSAIAKPGGAMTPREATEHANVWTRAAELLDFLADGPTDAVDRLSLFWAWTGGQTRHGEWSKVLARLKQARSELKPVPHELILTPRDTLRGWIAELEELDALNQRWWRLFSPRWWTLRKLPGAILDHCASLAQTPALVRPLDLCRAALPWHDLLEDLPDDNAFLDFGFQGDLGELDDAIEKLQSEHDRVLAVHRLHAKLSPRGGPYGDLPDLGLLELHDDPGAFLTAALTDRARARHWAALQPHLDALRLHFAPDWVDTIAADAEAGRIDAARAPLDAVIDARKDFKEAARLDQLCADEPAWIKRFLRGWRQPESGRWDPGQDAMTALRRAWRALLLDGQRPELVEAPLLDPAQLQHLSDDLATAIREAPRGVLGRYQARLRAAAADNAQSRDLRRLSAQALKRRRRLTLRQLVEQYWERGLGLVKPCWFCSPESVAALFPLQPGLFDLVVLDEASQCPVESAIPALVRSSGRAVIAGDDRQMPPSHFFRVRLDPGDSAEEDEGDVLASQSILTLARVAFRATTLRWHYRSRHESLIAFSNAAFYGRRLITAPSASGDTAPDQGLHWEQVDGLWQEQTNTEEAAQVVERVSQLLLRYAHQPVADRPTLGVIAFNRKQAQHISEQLSTASVDAPALRQALAEDAARPPTDQLFVRNIENVQGDERDIILFSVGYGPREPGGRIHARFGPLGQAGGERRLNVAISRARQAVWVIASFDPDQLDVAHTRHPGPKLLKRYLRFVRAVACDDTATLQAVLSEAEELGGGGGITGRNRGPVQGRYGVQVRDTLAKWLRAQPQVRARTHLGLGSQHLDLAVGRADAGSWSVGVDCSAFLHNPDDLSRDVYTPQFWRRLGWTLIRVTPSMWLHQRDRVQARVLQALDLTSTPHDDLAEP